MQFLSLPIKFIEKATCMYFFSVTKENSEAYSDQPDWITFLKSNIS